MGLAVQLLLLCNSLPLLDFMDRLASRIASKVDQFVAGRMKQIVALIRTQFLKRFESSAYAFERSCGRRTITTR